MTRRDGREHGGYALIERAVSPKENNPGQSESASDDWVSRPQDFQA